MNVLIVGSGAREHALAWRIRQSLHLHKLFISPGNKATAAIAENLGIQVSDKNGLLTFAKENNVGLTVVGPEIPLADGIVDLFQANDLAIFGPTMEAAKLEWSKSFAIEVMREACVPHPFSWFFQSPGAVLRFFQRWGRPIVVKADGLAAGKGVSICYTEDDVLYASRFCMTTSPGKPIVVQELLEGGREVSVFCFTDGWNISTLVAACDYKRAGEGNTGAMTGGMGSYAWPEFWTEELSVWVADYIIKPVLRHMAARGTPFQGVLYAGLMVYKHNLVPAHVLEFNCRLGDPEAQVILPLLETDPLKVMQACINSELDLTKVQWNKEASTVGVVIASERYPQDSVDGAAVLGLDKLNPDILVFEGGQTGRLMTLVAKGANPQEAKQRVYENIGRLRLVSAFYRGDIAIEAAVR